MRKELSKMNIMERISFIIIIIIEMRFIVKYVKEFIREVCKQEKESEK